VVDPAISTAQVENSALKTIAGSVTGKLERDIPTI
jgi:hypothetical protein